MIQLLRHELVCGIVLIMKIFISSLRIKVIKLNRNWNSRVIIYLYFCLMNTKMREIVSLTRGDGAFFSWKAFFSNKCLQYLKLL